jgi:integrase
MQVSVFAEKYKPRRDIPQAVRQLKSFSPSKIRDWIREHKTKKDRVTKKRLQLNVTPQSISMWFKRHPQILRRLKNEVIEKEVQREAISETMFENGAFRKIPCIQQMIIDMRGDEAKEVSINTNVSCIKRVCMGKLPQTIQQIRNKEQTIIIEDWGLKHPRALTVDDCLKFNSEMVKHKVGDRNWRLAMRCFLKSRGLKGWNKLSGKYKGAGKYAHVYAPPEKMRAIFAWLNKINREAHDASYFGFKTGCRIGATLEANAKYVDQEARTIWVFEKASKHTPKRKLKKKIPSDLWEVLKPRIERGGQLFNIKQSELNGLLKACYKTIIPELTEDIPMPFQFFRHQFAQHGLRATGWNTSLIAKLGGWTVGVLERYYGKMDEQTAFKEGEKFLAFI